MQKNLLGSVFLLLLLISNRGNTLFAQTEYRLFGTSTYSGGSIFSLNSTGSDLVTHKVFSANGNGPVGSMLESDGYLYGMTSGGGSSNAGTVFSVKKDGTQFQLIHEFNSADGSQPQNGLILATDGMLYGLTSRGGQFNNGIAFRIAKDGSGFQVLHEFLSSTGKTPVGPLMQGSDGDFYGMTSEGGDPQKGTVFKIDHSTFAYTVLHEFNGTADGAEPHGGLAEGLDGKLYGMTFVGGASGKGVVFNIGTSGSDFVVIREFSGTDGASPLGSLVRNGNGDFFGMTSKGGATDEGAIFKISPDGINYELLLELNTTTGVSPDGSMILANDFLYGVTKGAADPTPGTIFKLSTDGTVFSSLHAVADDSRFDMTGSLVLDGDDNVYGIKAPSGDLHADVGSVYRLDIQTLQFTTVHSFILVQGSIPVSRMVQGPDLRLYGTTVGGGAYGMGAIYSISSAGDDFQMVHSFQETEGKFAYGGLTPLSNGFFAGTTSFGGASLNGGVYKIKYDGTGFAAIHAFQQSEGSGLLGRVALGNDGKLYGLANGGTLGNGTIFRVGQDGNNFEVIHNLTAAEGSAPRGGLIKATNGSFYGVLSAGGANSLGVIFRIDQDKTYTKLYDFDGVTGSTPYGDLIEASDGKLYGMTSDSRDGGGTVYGAGVVFRINTDGSDYTVVHQFTQNEGGHPLGALTQAPTGEFYAMATAEGQFGTGYIFRLNQDGSGFLKLADLDFINGNPQSSLAVVPLLTQTITFDAIPAKTAGDPDFTLVATASSSLPVTFYSSDPDVATVSGNVVTIVGGGTATITARQKGNVYYSTATATRELVVNRKAQTITFGSISTKTLGAAPFAITATATSSLPVSFSTTSDKITISSGTVTMVKAGKATIQATQGGNTDYLPAPVQEQSFCINPVTPVINAGSTSLSSSSTAGNQWYFNGDIIAGATSVNYTPTQNGRYTVQVKVDDCVSEMSAFVEITITGFNEPLSNKVSVYPNPVRDEVYIEVSGGNGDLGLVALMDVTGRVIENRTVQANTASRFDTSNLARGMFFFRVRTENRITTHSFIRE